MREKRRKLRQLREVWGSVTASSVVMPRLDRGIQYAEASRLSHGRLGVLDRPVKPGDDSCACGERSACHCPHQALTIASLAIT
ncbi:hypothetical protein XH89_03315 [Bradyrhizobium sp. CCBAU 53340]|nr:hypothetical protein XH89_03315 [Bradyrhizobium sp. CCBAU 53340]